MSLSADVRAVARRVAALYGHDLRDADGVIHVTSARRRPGGGLESLAINDSTPRSATDGFVLALARARADALVTTGRILREEPALTHAAQSGGTQEQSEGTEGDLAAWRREVHGRSQPPITVVLTGGAALDLNHPALRGPQPRVIYTTESAANALAGEARSRGIEVVGDAAPSLRGLLSYLERDRGCRTLLVEAGARTSSELYRSPPVVDELLLSICGAEVLDERARGPALPNESVIADAGLVLRSECRSEEQSGPWWFRRYRR